MNYERSFVLRILLCLALAGALCSSASAAVTDYWTVATGSWGYGGATSTNWSTGYVPAGAAYPLPGDTAIINNGGEATVDVTTGYFYTPSNLLRNIYVGYSDSGTDPASGSGTLTMSVGSGTQRLYASNGIIVGCETATATGSVTGTLNINGGNRITMLNPASDNTDNLTVGQNGNGFDSTGIVNQTAGTVNVGSSLYIGSNGASTGSYTISGGILNVHNNAGDPWSGAAGGTLILGQAGTSSGTMTISGTAQVNIQNGGAMWVGNRSSGTQVVTQTGGTVNLPGTFNGAADTGGGANILIVGTNAGTSTYNLSGGTINSPQNGVSIAWFGTATTGTLNLNAGGTLVTAAIFGGSYWGMGTANLYFNGGTVVAAGSQPNFIFTAFSTASVPLNAYVSTGGAIIDTSGYDVGINVDLIHNPAIDIVNPDGTTTPVIDGGLTKLGDGTLSLNGPNISSVSDFTGPIQVNGGTLRVNQWLMGGQTCTVASGAGIGGTGNLYGSTIIVASGGSVSPGSIATPGTISAGSLSVTAATLNYRLGSIPGGTGDQIALTGDLTLAGISNVAVNPYQGSLGAGSYTLITYGGVLTGGKDNLNMALGGPYTGLDPKTFRQTFDFDTISTPGVVYLNVTGDKGNLTWTGAVNNNWDAANRTIPGKGTANWLNAGSPPTPDVFYTVDDVTFAGGVNPLTVNLTESVYPGNVSMDLAGGTCNLGAFNLTAYSLTLINGSITGTGTVSSVSAPILQSGTISANMSGTVGFLKTTTGTVTLQGTNNAQTAGGYIGVSAGTLVFDTGAVMTGNSSLITGDTVGQPATTVIRSGSSYTGDWFVVGNNDLGIVKSAGNINANAGLIVGGAATSGAANGYMVHTAGTINTAGLSIADSSNSFGSYVLSGGTINETSGDAIIANNSNGIMTIMPGAAFNVADGAFMSFHMGGSGGLGVMVQRGGSVSFSSNAAYDTLVNQMQIQVNSGSDVYNQLGGTVSAASYDSASATPNVSGIGGIGLIWYNGWNPGDDNMSMAIYNLNGGTLTTSNIHSGSIWNGSNNLYAYLNFHGGTLQAAADSTNFIYHVLGTASGAGTAAVDMPNGITAATVYKEGAVIDTNGHNITIQTALVKPDGQGVSNIAVMTAGSGYLSAPIIRLDTATGDTGIGATAIADMVQDPDGTYHIADIAITNPGTGYGAAPTVTILGGNPATTATLGVPVLSLNDSSGGLTKQGSGILTLTGALTYGGLTDIQAGTLQINTSSVPVSLAAITGASDAALGVGDGTNATSLTATSVSVGTLTLGAGSTLTIAAIPGGPLAGPGGISAVPEPSTITLLALAGTGLLIAAWRKRQS